MTDAQRELNLAINRAQAYLDSGCRTSTEYYYSTGLLNAMRPKEDAKPTEKETVYCDRDLCVNHETCVECPAGDRPEKDPIVEVYEKYHGSELGEKSSTLAFRLDVWQAIEEHVRRVGK